MNTIGNIANTTFSSRQIQPPELKKAGTNIQFAGKQTKAVEYTPSSNFCGIPVFKSIRVACASMISIPLFLLDGTYKFVTAPFRWVARIIAGKNQPKESRSDS